MGVVALVPATVHPDSVSDGLKGRHTSYEEHAEHTINTKGAMKAFWDAFDAPPTYPHASPLLHDRIGELKKVYLAVAGHDTLRDDGLLFKEKMESNS